ncbi:unnamed protein product [Rotaria sp. Silwood1]|nr:unnamed protein product [Rotaria sp. Silwood1]CAF1674123.1 unnamed protein product [Rotaria sp. Silwood1]CAF3774603.1 unnamed protein product [Rotaria sp. Silwood1]CAF4769934.1 unnamed protein product [Rotaria sp. Silwood1]
MEDSFIQLNSLPDEILMIIFKKLNNFDVLYSLMGINKRLDSILQDSIFTRYLTLTKPPSGSKQFTDTIIDRICVEILPKIHDKIEWLNIESSFINRILLSTNYPNLHTLVLHDLSLERARDLFTNRSYFICVFEYQLSSLVIHTDESQEATSSFEDINIFLYTQILTMFKNLQYLNFSPFAHPNNHQLTFNLSSPNVFSSTLLHLHVIVDTFEDCLYLLDGRFNQLHTFDVTIYFKNVSVSPLINNKNNLPNLKCFRLTHKSMLVYKTFLIPLLRRMPNLEELGLYFVNPIGPIIDGINLKENIFNYMPKLKKFEFDIHSLIRFNNQFNLPSNEDIQNTFKNVKSNQIISCIDYFPKIHEFQCHIYSYPYTLNYYESITNNFPGGLFTCVHHISLFDERPFEHEFFLQIAKSFPFIKDLRLCNLEPQNNNKQQQSIIEYPHLIILDLRKIHVNYLEQFLNNTKMSLLNDIILHVNYNLLQRVTDNFTRNAARINCSKVQRLFLYNKRELSPGLKDYFPRAAIL